MKKTSELTGIQRKSPISHIVFITNTIPVHSVDSHESESDEFKISFPRKVISFLENKTKLKVNSQAKNKPQSSGNWLK